MATKVAAIWPDNVQQRSAIARSLRRLDCDYFVRDGERWAHVVTPADRHGASTPPTPIRRFRRWPSFLPDSMFPKDGGPGGAA